MAQRQRFTLTQNQEVGRLNLSCLKFWNGCVYFFIKKESANHCDGRIWHRRMLPHGLEPWTSRLLAERSSQLSYESCWCTSRRLSYGWRQQHITQDDEVMHVGELIFGPGLPLDMARYKYAPIFTNTFVPEKPRISVRMLAEKQADC